MRIVPRANDAINETWIADRDRFSYDGFYAADRARKPMVKDGGTWRHVDWEIARESAETRLQ
jgi:NADH-quinone oxidoreductase subunit G